jgi:hypothetical protein
MFLEEDTMTRSIRIRLRRAIGFGLALGVVIAPNALAKPFIEPGSSDAASPSAAKTLPASSAYGFYRPAGVASAKAATIAVAHDAWGGDIRAARIGVVRPVSSTTNVAPLSATTFHDSWGSDVGTAVPPAVNASSSSNDTRNVLLAASAAGLLLIGGGSLVLMLRRRRAQLA